METDYRHVFVENVFNSFLVELARISEALPSRIGARLAGMILAKQAAEDGPANAFVEPLTDEWRIQLARALGYIA